MNDIRIGTPKVSGQQGIPEPFNINDVIVFKALICKFMCRKDTNRFSKSSFLQWVVDEKIESYTQDELNKAIKDFTHEYNRLMEFCLDAMITNNLFTRQRPTSPNDFDYNSYRATPKLRTLCPNILKYYMPDIEKLAKSVGQAAEGAAAEIKKDKNRLRIVNLLEHLKVKKEMDLSDAIEYVDKRTLQKLVEIGSVKLYLNNKIAISYEGEQMLFKFAGQQT
jgi:hypothetical protein